MNNQLTPIEAAKLLAQANYKDSFKESSTEVFNAFSKEIYPYLMDHYYLISDLRVVINEDINRHYNDYCFVVVPVHKAFELYVRGFLKGTIKLNVSTKNNESIGHYLGLDDKAKNKLLDNIENNFVEIGFKPIITKISWLNAWNALARQWKNNRNPLTHPEGEKMDTLKQAEIVGSAIVREMDSTAQLIAKEFFNPLVEFLKKREEEKMERVKER